MAAPFLELHAVTLQARHEIMPAVRDAIHSAGGWVTGYQEFSNKSVCVQFEIDERRCLPLLEALRTCAGTLDPKSVRCLEQAHADGDRTSMGTLQISLVHDGPDEKSVIPAVPG